MCVRACVSFVLVRGIEREGTWRETKKERGSTSDKREWVLEVGRERVVRDTGISVSTGTGRIRSSM